MACSPDQSNELGVLDGHDGIVSPDFLSYFERLTVQLGYFNCSILG